MKPLTLNARSTLLLRAMAVSAKNGPLACVAATPSSSPALCKRFYAGGHGHEVMNPGPPITFDYMPIPCQPYKRVYAELQRKFNLYLVVSLCVFGVSCYLAYYFDAFEAEQTMRRPQSYRNRKIPKSWHNEVTP